MGFQLSRRHHPELNILFNSSSGEIITEPHVFHSDESLWDRLGSTPPLNPADRGDKVCEDVMRGLMCPNDQLSDTRLLQNTPSTNFTLFKLNKNLFLPI